MEKGNLKSKFTPGATNMSQYLRSSGILGAYEKLLTSLYSNGWPGNKSIYSYSAEEILRYGSHFQQEFKGIIGKDFEKKAKVIHDAKEKVYEESTPKNIISMKREPFVMKSKTSLDLSAFDKPRSPLSRGSKEINRFRGSNRDDDFIQLDLTKPEKKDIVLIDEPDLTPDENYYQKSFQQPPQEDILGMSMQSVQRSLEKDQDQVNHSLDVKNDDNTYIRQEEWDDTHREDELKGRIDTGVEDGVNIGGDTKTNEQYSDNEQQPDDEEEGNDERPETLQSQDRPISKGSASKHNKTLEDDVRSSNKTPVSKNSNRSPASRASNRTPNSKASKKR